MKYEKSMLRSKGGFGSLECGRRFVRNLTIFIVGMNHDAHNGWGVFSVLWYVHPCEESVLSYSPQNVEFDLIKCLMNKSTCMFGFGITKSFVSKIVCVDS